MAPVCMLFDAMVAFAPSALTAAMASEGSQADRPLHTFERAFFFGSSIWLYSSTDEPVAAPAVPPTSAPPTPAATFAAKLPSRSEPVSEATPFERLLNWSAIFEARPAPAAPPAAVKTLPPPSPPISAPPAACNRARLSPPSVQTLAPDAPAVVETGFPPMPQPPAHRFFLTPISARNFLPRRGFSP